MMDGIMTTVTFGQVTVVAPHGHVSSANVATPPLVYNVVQFGLPINSGTNVLPGVGAHIGAHIIYNNEVNNHALRDPRPLSGPATPVYIVNSSGHNISMGSENAILFAQRDGSLVTDVVISNGSAGLFIFTEAGYWVAISAGMLSN